MQNLPIMGIWHRRTLLAICLACTACDMQLAQQDDQQPKPAFSIVNLNNQVTLKVPAEYMAVHDLVRAEEVKAGDPVPRIAFAFVMPDYSGTVGHAKLSNEDIVDVFVTADPNLAQMEPDAPGYYPPNSFARATSQPYPTVDKNVRSVHYSLDCYSYQSNKDPSKSGGFTNRNLCYGERDQATKEMILMDVDFPPNPSWASNPQMQARYFTPNYGGMHVVWRTNIKWLPQWKSIDQQVWKFIHNWDVSQRTKKNVSNRQSSLIKRSIDNNA